MKNFFCKVLKRDVQKFQKMIGNYFKFKTLQKVSKNKSFCI